MDLELKSHGVLVTGGASGIGLAIATGFAREGAHVSLWDVSQKVTQVAEQLASVHGVRTHGRQVDVANEPQVQAALAATEAELGPVQHLIHAAAVGSGKFGFPFTRLEACDWQRVLQVNILGMVHVAHAVAPRMRERREGTVLFIGSVAGQIGSQSDPPYSASKAANINFAQCLAKDLAPHGVRVNTLCPGMVQTPLNESVWAAWNAEKPPEQRQSYADWADAKIRQLVPLGRWQTPEDIADMAVFLSSNRARQVTGQTINVDGGYVMHW